MTDEDVRAYLDHIEWLTFSHSHEPKGSTTFDVCTHDMKTVLRTLARARRALRVVEWSGDDTGGYCPLCNMSREYGHHPDCIFHDMPGDGK